MFGGLKPFGPLNRLGGSKRLGPSKRLGFFMDRLEDQIAKKMRCATKKSNHGFLCNQK